jgi:uncharacterized protein YjiS (DUF1127 family)
MMAEANSNQVRSMETTAIPVLLSLLRAIAVGLRSCVHTLQTARMYQALSQLSDRQLDQIGITRQEIPQYVERLMSHEDAGES